MSQDLAIEYDNMNRVIDQLLKGESPTKIAKSTGFTRAKVLGYIEQWKNWVSQEQDVVTRARETLQLIDQHYGLLIQEAWRTIEQADNAGEYANKIAAMKLLAQLEKDRHAAFQAAGLTDQQGMADEIAETERKQEILANILKDVSKNCPRCRIEVKKKLDEFAGRTEPIEVEPLAIAHSH